MYQEKKPKRAISVDSVKINTSLEMMWKYVHLQTPGCVNVQYVALALFHFGVTDKYEECVQKSEKTHV